MKKSTLFTAYPRDKGNCEFKLWDRNGKCLEPCMEPGCAYTAGNKKYYLCPEHGAFVQDAHDLRFVAYQAELLKADAK
jgi:hypothetical protein